jgi:hypothetical protein
MPNELKFLSLSPFIPSGPDMEASKQLFQELGFAITWDAGDYVGFERDGCKFTLQKYDDKHFAENLMISVAINDAEEFKRWITTKNLEQKFGVRISDVIPQPYGKEVNLIDIAGVCWHFVE